MMDKWDERYHWEEGTNWINFILELMYRVFNNKNFGNLRIIERIRIQEFLILISSNISIIFVLEFCNF